MRETTDEIADPVTELELELGQLRQAISKEYEEVANY